MNEWIVQAIIAFVFGLAIPYVISIIKPEWLVKLIVSVLSRYQKDEKICNSISNQLGEKLVEIGSQLITYYPDEPNDGDSKSKS